MARVLLTWELGGGLGHLVNLEPLARSLSRRGHEVYAALKDVSRADRVFDGADVSLLQAPVLNRRLPNYVQRPHTFSHILHNNGFGDRATLGALAEAWKHLYRYVRPDLIVFDHSPTALLASRGTEAARALIGTGFFVPPPVYPLPNLRAEPPVDPAELRRCEDRILDNANALLSGWDQPPMQKMADLYGRIDRNFLATFEELDHYPNRVDGRYVGAWPTGIGRSPQWPSGTGARIYAYLKPFPALPSLLQTLAELKTPTLVYVDGVDAELLRGRGAENIRFELHPLELGRVGRECDLAILNGNHGTTVAMLLAGKPTLQIPLHLEQALFAGAVERIGAGLRADNDDPEMIRRRVDEMLGSDRFTRAAESFAARHSAADLRLRLDAMLDDAESLLPGSTASVRKQPAEPEHRDPLSLVHYKRFDLMAKYIHADHRRWAIKSPWARQLYLTHIRVFNNFYEEEPPKDGPDDFINAFDDLLDSVRDDGFLAQRSAVIVGNDGVLINGSHRLAACLLYGRPIACKVRREPATDFSFAWFLRHTRFVSTGLPVGCGDPMALEYARLKPSCRMLLVATPGKLDEAALVRCLREHGDVVYARRLELDGRSMGNFVRLLDKRRLTGPIDGHATAAAADSRVRAFLYEWRDGSDPAELREHLHVIDESSGISLAASVDRETTVELAELLFNSNGVEWLARLKNLPDGRFDAMLADLDAMLADLDALLSDHQIPRRNVCLFGDAATALYGQGGCRRPDVLVASPVAHLPADPRVNFHRTSPGTHNAPSDELIANPRHHFHYRGFKFLRELRGTLP